MEILCIFSEFREELESSRRALFYARYNNKYFFLSYPTKIATAKKNYLQQTKSLETYKKHADDLKRYNKHPEIIRHNGTVLIVSRPDLQ